MHYMLKTNRHRFAIQCSKGLICFLIYWVYWYMLISDNSVEGLNRCIRWHMKREHCIKFVASFGLFNLTCLLMILQYMSCLHELHMVCMGLYGMSSEVQTVRPSRTPRPLPLMLLAY